MARGVVEFEGFQVFGKALLQLRKCLQLEHVAKPLGCSTSCLSKATPGRA